jgi:hypothetical protein
MHLPARVQRMSATMAVMKCAVMAEAMQMPEKSDRYQPREAEAKTEQVNTLFDQRPAETTPLPNNI